MIPMLSPRRANWRSRRQLKAMTYFLYFFLAVIVVLMSLSYRKILIDMQQQLESGSNANGKVFNPGLMSRSEIIAKARASAKAFAAAGVGGGRRKKENNHSSNRNRKRNQNINSAVESLRNQHHHDNGNGNGNGNGNEKGSPHASSTCAILLFGLPRAFKDFVLPSLERNVIRPNAKYGCDYFVHYYQQDSEPSGRSGRGGLIRSEDIFLLGTSVTNIHQEQYVRRSSSSVNNTVANELPPPPRVAFVSDTNETFWEKRRSVIQHYRTAKNADGNYSFYPYGERTYEYPGTLDNIVRQWHSVNAVWDSMEEASSKKDRDQNESKNYKMTSHQYRRVAMMRNDVIYLTPIDIYSIPVVANESKKGPVPHQTIDDYSTNTRSVIPNFAKYPVNDRLIYGPYSAVEIWASQRFTKIEEYAKDPSATPGMIMHSETFLNASILQSIREMGIDNDDVNTDKRKKNDTIANAIANTTANHQVLFEDSWMCFLRVRADGAIWIEDCDESKSGFGGGYPGGEKAYTKLLREFLPNRGRKCKKRHLRDKVRKIMELVCPKPGHELLSA